MLVERLRSEIDSGGCDSIPLKDEVLAVIRAIPMYFDTRSEQTEKDFKDILVILRDGCVKNVALQNQLVDNILGACLDTLVQLLSIHDTIDKSLKMKNLSFMFSLLQLISVGVTSNQVNQEFLQSYQIPYNQTTTTFFAEPTRLLLEFTNRKIITATCSVIYNSIVNNDTVRASFLEQNHFKDLLDHVYATVTEKPNEKKEPTDQASEWIYLIFIKLFTESDYQTKLVEQLLAEDESERLLHLLEVMDIYCGKKADKMNVGEAYTDQEIHIMTSLSVSAIHILKHYFYSVYQKEKTENDGTLKPSHMYENKNKTVLSYKQFECLFVCIEIIANVLISESETIQNTLEKNNLIVLVTDMMKVASMEKEVIIATTYEGYKLNKRIYLQTRLPILSRHDERIKQEDDQDEENDDHMFYGYKSNLIRIMGNICHLNRNNQESIREHGGIPIILNHCGVDFENPYLREWSVLCLRNVCEENLENQERILKYQAQTVDSNTQTMMEQMGVGVNLNPNTGRVDVQRPPDNPPQDHPDSTHPDLEKFYF